MEIEYNASLKELNTFGVEVKAKALAVFANDNELKQTLQDENLKNMPRMILGGGSNVLFTKDFDGLILKNNIKGIALVEETDDHYFVKAGAGENWHEFVQYCISKGYSGLENLSLIPGNVGASPMQNIGAYGVEIKDRFHVLEAMDVHNFEIKTFDAATCKFGYRESIFKTTAKDRYVILSVTFKLPRKAEYYVEYGAIQDEMAKLGVRELSIKGISDAVINIRNSKLPNPAELGNAGSFFKNPVVSTEKWEKIARDHPEIPHYPAPDNKVKLAAGWLIEQAGWKGKKIGNCGMHARQALVLVNYGGATGEEILKLSSDVMGSVKDKFGVELEREVNIL